jgi:voltage-gated potassium channel
VGAWVLRVAFTGIFIAGFLVANGHRRMRGGAVLLIAIVVLVEWGTYFIEIPNGDQFHIGATASLLFLTAFAQLYTMLTQQESSSDTIFCGINIYILIALGFMMLHSLAELAQPGSYEVQGQDLIKYLGSQEQGEVFPTMAYFSFLTITTLGYGDIVPVSGVSRMLVSLEALIGQLYPATFIAGIVSRHMGSRNAARNQED